MPGIVAHCRRLRRRSSTRARSSASSRTSRTGATSHQGGPPPPAVPAIAAVRACAGGPAMLPPDAPLAPGWLVASRVPTGWASAHVVEAPAQQGGRVAPGVQVAVHHRGDQGVAAAGGGADEGAARLGGPAGLDPDGAAVVQQQPVLGVDLEGLADLPGLGHLAGELRLHRGDVVAEVLTGHRGPGEDREVVGRGVLPRRVQAAGVADRGVQGAQALARWRSSRRPSAGPRRRRSPGRWPRRCPTPGRGPGTSGAPCRWRPAPARPGCPRRWRPPTARCRRRRVAASAAA